MANEKARSIRKRATDHERILWTRLRRFKTIGFHFRCQHPIGPFVADFACISAGLVIELDGSQHGEARVAKFDLARDEFLRGHGYTVHRISNLDVR
jgi:very-short-patch-repair endonuclease